MSADPKPERRIVDRNAKPLDETPLRTGQCPLCGRKLVYFSRHHVVPKGQGGDDVAENLVWVCGDGTRGCHGVLTHRNRDGETGLTFEDVAGRLILYLRLHRDDVYLYVRGKKYSGWIGDYYGELEAA